VAAAGFLIASVAAASAAGAFAVGACGAYGYGFDYRTMADARAAAMRKCAGSDCKIVGDLRRACAAMAVDAKHPCGSYGWAVVMTASSALGSATKRADPESPSINARRQSV
jgi:hypothetical protein